MACSYPNCKCVPLVSECRQGQHSAFDALVHAIEPQIRKAVRRCLHRFRWHEIDDLTQESLFKIYCNLDQCEAPHGVCPWAEKIAKFTSIDHLRRIKRAKKAGFGREQRSLEEEYELLDEHTKKTVLDIQVELEDEAALKAFVLSMNVPDHELLANLYLWLIEEGKTHREAAQLANVSVKTVGNYFREIKRRTIEYWKMKKRERDEE